VTAATLPLATNAARPAVIEDPSNLWLIHRLADALLPLAIRAGIHPNLVSFTGMGCGLAAAAAYWHWQRPGMALLGLGLMLAWHVCDGLDGKLARATGKFSALGRLVDGICDYVTFISVYLALVFSLADWQGALALALASGACHVLQSAWYEGCRESRKRRARGDFARQPRPRAGWVVERGYNRLEALGQGNAALDAALAANPAGQERALAATAPVVRAMCVLSANWRTLAIALACLAGDPRWFWRWEIAGLSALAVIMALWLGKRERDSIVVAHG
jgi:CDP-diacylglycerol--serine O-phosphatidyltransferase